MVSRGKFVKGRAGLAFIAEGPFQVAAGAKRLALAGDHERQCAVIHRKSDEAPGKKIDRIEVERVEGPGPVQHHDCYVAFSPDRYCLCHRIHLRMRYSMTTHRDFFRKFFKHSSCGLVLRINPHSRP